MPDGYKMVFSVYTFFTKVVVLKHKEGNRTIWIAARKPEKEYEPGGFKKKFWYEGMNIKEYKKLGGFQDINVIKTGELRISNFNVPYIIFRFIRKNVLMMGSFFCYYEPVLNKSLFIAAFGKVGKFDQTEALDFVRSISINAY